MKIKTIEKDEAVLRQISTEVDFDNDDYEDYIDILAEYCRSHVVYALSPVQLGIPKRIIYLRNTTDDMDKNSDFHYNEETILINPKIISMKGHSRFLEGCESCQKYVAVIDRPYSVVVEYYNTDRKKITETIEGFKATVFCHEYDHLNGILHIDLSDNVTEMTLEERKVYRKEHPYEVISKQGEFKKNN